MAKNDKMNESNSKVPFFQEKVVEPLTSPNYIITERERFL